MAISHVGLACFIKIDMAIQKEVAHAEKTMEENLLQNGDAARARPVDIALSADQVTDESKKKAEEIKEKANDFFKSEDFL